MNASDLRIAMFSGNYNMTVDGANKALNRLAEFVLRQGVTLRVYSPTIDQAAFEPQGDLVSLPSVPIPGRSEYRIPYGLNDEVRRDLESFRPNMMHISSPDFRKKPCPSKRKRFASSRFDAVPIQRSASWWS